MITKQLKTNKLTQTKKYCIYIGSSPMPSVKDYIGKTSNIRKRMNKYSCYRCETQWMLHAALKKYGFASFKWEIVFESDDLNEINAKEEELIARYDTTNPENGYNIQKGGDCCLNFAGRHHNEAAKEMMRLAHIGRKDSEYTREKKSKVQMGANNSFAGRKHSEESKAKMRMNNEKRIAFAKTRRVISDATAKLIHDAYVAGGVTLNDLAAQYGCGFSTIRRTILRASVN